MDEITMAYISVLISFFMIAFVSFLGRDLVNDDWQVRIATIKKANHFLMQIFLLLAIISGILLGISYSIIKG